MATNEKNTEVIADARRSEIIHIATKLFLDKGFSGTSMADLAEACGIKKASFYHYFRSKDELFISCVITGYAPALDELRVLSRAEDLTHEDRLHHAIDVLYDITVNSDVGRLSPLIAEVSRKMPELSQRFYAEYIAVQRQTLKAIVEAGIAAGAFKRPDYDVLYHIVFGPIVTLSLSREMFAEMGDLETMFPTCRLKDGHKKIVVDALRP
ncbi:MAG: TetR/AcrR family transcriptional regulator [Pseudomonadota bacterium]